MVLLRWPVTVPLFYTLVTPFDDCSVARRIRYVAVGASNNCSYPLRCPFRCLLIYPCRLLFRFRYPCPYLIYVSRYLPLYLVPLLCLSATCCCYTGGPVLIIVVDLVTALYRSVIWCHDNVVVVTFPLLRCYCCYRCSHCCCSVVNVVVVVVIVHYLVVVVVVNCRFI